MNRKRNTPSLWNDDLAARFEIGKDHAEKGIEAIKTQAPGSKSEDLSAI